MNIKQIILDELESNTFKLAGTDVIASTQFDNIAEICQLKIIKHAINEDSRIDGLFPGIDLSNVEFEE